MPSEHFYFRNLDGNLKVLSHLSLCGKTIQTRARLLSSVAGSGTVVQKFSFELSCQGQVFCEGEFLFGYFNASSMANQIGLDGGAQVLPWFKQHAAPEGRWLDLPHLQQSDPSRPYAHLATERMSFIDDLYLEEKGGRHGQGYLYASRAVNPQDWFYPFHFYQDPVMPGSLGVEAILQVMQAYALVSGFAADLRSPRFGVAVNAPPFSWRYRGQITTKHRLMELEVHLTGLQKQVDPSGAPLYVLLGDANLWVDGLRIYEVKNAAVSVLES